MDRYKASTRRDILEVESEPHLVMNYRGYGLGIIVRNQSDNKVYEMVIDGIKSLATQLEPLVESNGGSFSGLRFGIKKASKERSSAYVLDTRTNVGHVEDTVEDSKSTEDKLWRKISSRYN